jgi:hypothetical protein
MCVIDMSSQTTSPSGEDYDIAALLEFEGPSLQQSESITEAQEILDFRDTERNYSNISALLSSQGIRFHIQEPARAGWPGIRHRLVVTVPGDRYREAQALLRAAVEASALEVVEGNEGLIAY